MSWAEDNGIDIGVPYWYEELDELEMETGGRLYLTAGDVETCSNCGSTNIKLSKAGNKYCADLCWVEKEEQTNA